MAEQIFKVLDPLSRELGLYTYAVYGGVSYTKQFKALDRGVDILVACPGRLIDLIDRGSISLEDVDIVVLDEADRMADMGFMQPVCQILDECREDRKQFCLVLLWMMRLLIWLGITKLIQLPLK